jgi:hypothetical protein
VLRPCPTHAGPVLVTDHTRQNLAYNPGSLTINLKAVLILEENSPDRTIVQALPGQKAKETI